MKGGRSLVRATGRSRHLLWEGDCRGRARGWLDGPGCQGLFCQECWPTMTSPFLTLPPSLHLMLLDWQSSSSAEAVDGAGGTEGADGADSDDGAAASPSWGAAISPARPSIRGSSGTCAWIATATRLPTAASGTPSRGCGVGRVPLDSAKTRHGWSDTPSGRARPRSVLRPRKSLPSAYRRPPSRTRSRRRRSMPSRGEE